MAKSAGLVRPVTQWNLSATERVIGDFVKQQQITRDQRDRSSRSLGLSDGS